MLSFSAARAAIKPSVAFISTNAALNPLPASSVVQDFRNHFWEAFSARSLEHKVPALPSKHLRESDVMIPPPEDDRATMLRKCARDDLFKHVRMSAASRAMKRGDGVMSKDFSLGLGSTMHRDLPTNGSTVLCTEQPSLIDVATALKAREDMYHHFWAAHLARQEATNQVKVRRPTTPTVSASTSSSPLHEHLHEHRYALPHTLREAYSEFGGRMRGINHHPRPMAITETTPPFKIVDVNKPWSKLCGYSREEAVNSTLKDLLQGPETNALVASNLVASLLEHDGAEQEAVLVNYDGRGRKFRNHVRIGRITDDAGVTSHFVGVFSRLSDGDEKMSTASDEDVYANV